MADALDAWTEELTRDPSLSGWVSWYWLVRRLDGDQLLGCGGFKGRPDAQGIVEIGYAVCDEHRQRGYAAEAVAALCRWALSHSPVRRIDAETLPHLDASIALLSRLGFRRLPSTDPPVLRFGLSKPL
jgi:RimJ/RimL family protein N-acetyltransferase